MHFGFRSLEDYEQWIVDVGGPFAVLVRGLAEEEREVLRAQLREAFAPFAADGGCELPGAALCAVASRSPRRPSPGAIECATRSGLTECGLGYRIEAHAIATACPP